MFLLLSCKENFVEIENINSKEGQNINFANNRSDNFTRKNQFILQFIKNKDGIYSEYYGSCPVSQDPYFQLTKKTDTIIIDYTNKYRPNFNGVGIEESRLFKAKFSIKTENIPKILLIRKEQIR